MTATLYRNGHVYAPGAPDASALVVDGRTVAWVGADPSTVAAPAEVVDLGGALVTPAFVDAHVHTTATGMALAGLDLSGARSLAEALDLVERHARQSGGRPVLGHGWDDTRWPERRPPSRAELDRASYGGAVYLSRVDVHSAAVSSALLAAAPTARGLAGYSETGLLTLDAHHAVRSTAFQAITVGQRRQYQETALRHAASLGIGALHELAGPGLSSTEDLRALIALAAAEPVPDVLPYWGEAGPAGLRTAAELGALGAAGDTFVDGSLGSHTACLSTPYADAPDTSGHAYLDPDAVAAHAVAGTRAGLQVGFHAIGDAAVRTVLTGYAKAAAEVGLGAFRALRHRIEHVELIDPELVAELARLGVVASVQPAFDAEWGGPDQMYAGRLGVQRALATNPFGSLAAAGVPLAFGSDAPVTPLAPWAGVRAAVHHHVAAQRLTPAAAFEAHTVGGWVAAGIDEAGTLVAGAPATFAAWDVPGGVQRGGSLLPNLAPDRPLPTCLRTVVRGVTVYEVGK